jgi:NADH dehydrogenase
VVVSTAGEGRRRIDARTVIWAAGVQASPLGAQLASQSGSEIDRAGRLSVDADLTLAGHPEVFAVGDMISVRGVPGTAQPAMQERTCVAFLAWGAIHLAYLVGWGSRVETVGRWGWTLLARNRRERLISINSLATGGPILRELGVTQRASIDGVHPPADVLAAP